MAETHQAPDFTEVERKLGEGDSKKTEILAKADTILEQLAVLQDLLAVRLKRGPEYEMFSKRLEALHQVKLLLAKVKAELKGTDDEEEWKQIVADGMAEIQTFVTEQQGNGNKIFFQGLSSAIADMTAAAMATKSIEDDLLLPYNVHFGAVQPRVNSTADDLLRAGFPGEGVREGVREAVFALIKSIAEQDQMRGTAVGLGKDMLENDYIALFEQEQRLNRDLVLAKRGLGVDEKAIEDEQKRLHAERCHARDIELRDELAQIPEDDVNGSDKTALAQSRCRDDKSNFERELGEKIAEAIRIAYEEAEQKAGNKAYSAIREEYDGVQLHIERLLRSVQMIVATSEKAKSAAAVVLSANDQKKAPGTDPNNETVELMRNLKIPAAVSAVKEIRTAATAELSTAIENINVAELAKKVGSNKNFDMERLAIQRKYEITEPAVAEKAPEVTVAPTGSSAAESTNPGTGNGSEATAKTEQPPAAPEASPAQTPAAPAAAPSAAAPGDAK